MAQNATNEFETILAELIRRETTNQLAVYNPYPFQKAWHNAKGHDTADPARQKCLMCANRIGKCAPITLRVETPSGDVPLRQLWGKPAIVLGEDGGPKQVQKWVRKPPNPCVRVELDDGRFFECSLDHVVLSSQGWLSIRQISTCLPKSVFHVHGFRESVRVNGLRFAGKLRGFLGRCFQRFRLCGERLHCDRDNVQVFVPSQDGSEAHSLIWYDLGDLAHKCKGSARRIFARLSNWGVGFQTSAQFAVSSTQGGASRLSPKTGSIRNELLSVHQSNRHCVAGGILPDQTELCASSNSLCVSGNKIVRIIDIGVHPIYDMQVDGGAYRAAGLVHHNTFCGTMEDAIHATGIYPDWWEGIRFTHAVNILVAGITADLVRDTLQAKLLGDPHNPDEWGMAAIPKDLIEGKPARKQGYVNAIDSIGVRHVSGAISRIKFQAYEQGAKKFMATGFHVVHLDEEPPQDIYSQGLRAITDTHGIINLTFTPEDGITGVVDGFMNELKEGQAFITATWDDAAHIKNNPKHRDQLLAALPPQEREMRSKGIPQMGSGMIYPVQDEMLMCEPFEIPIWWPRICAIDFGGFEHPFAAVWLALDRDTDTTYLYKTYKNMGGLPIHCDALKRQDCEWIPVVWPHDVGHADKTSGRPLSVVMRDDYGLNMLPRSFCNPPGPGQQEGQGGIGVEVGLWNILTAMETGRFKVFSNLSDWFREKGLYHRKDGKIVKRMDDLMDGTRYAYQSQRFADIRPRPVSRKSRIPSGVRNW